MKRSKSLPKILNPPGRRNPKITAAVKKVVAERDIWYARITEELSVDDLLALLRSKHMEQESRIESLEQDLYDAQDYCHNCHG